MNSQGARRILLTLGVVAAFLGAGQSLGAEGTKKPKSSVIEGTLVDTKCYSIDKAHKQDRHETTDGPIDGCAAACAKAGVPVAVLGRKDELTILIAPAMDLAPYMGRSARVTGVKVYKGAAIRAEKIEVRDESGAWKAVDLHTMM